MSKRRHSVLYYIKHYVSTIVHVCCRLSMCCVPFLSLSLSLSLSLPQDVVTRYAHQSGFHVERRFGWDCHGLPVEYEIDKTLGIKVRCEGGTLRSHQKEYHIILYFSGEMSLNLSKIIIYTVIITGARRCSKDGRGSLQRRVSKNCHKIFKGMGGQSICQYACGN